MPARSSTSVRVFYPEFDQTYLLRTLPERLERLDIELPLIQAILFGSFAKGNYTVGSDVDILIIYKGEARSDAYTLTKKRLGIPRLEPHLYSEEEHGEMKETIHRMSEGGILLFLCKATSPK